jgi:hypothetical protein
MAARWCLRGGSGNINVFFGLFVWRFLVRLCQKKIIMKKLWQGGCHIPSKINEKTAIKNWSKLIARTI